MSSSEGETPATVLYTTYSDMIRHAGGIPVVIPVGSPEDAENVVDRIDGLVTTGGGDVAPGTYGGSLHPSVYAVDLARDQFEFALTRAAAAARLPTLTICRGMQVANVAFGGTLVEDIADHDPAAIAHLMTGSDATAPQHVVEFIPGSRIAEVLETTTVKVNTVHHQAIRRIAPHFRVAGRAPDGMIEAIEPVDPAWPMLGVQWHPEWLGPEDSPSARLFQAFIDTTRERP